MSIDHAAVGEPDVEASSMVLVRVDHGRDPAEWPIFAGGGNIFDEDQIADFDVCGSAFRTFGELLQVESLERIPVPI